MVINPYIFKREPNIIFKGLGGLGITREMFLEDTRDINRWNIRAFVDDGTDLKLHINKQFVLDRFGSQRVGSETPVRLLIGQNITGIEDVTGLIYRIENNTLFNVSNLCDFNFQGLESIGNEGFRDVQRALTFSAPQLVLLEYAEPLVNLGFDNGGNPINSEFPILEGDGYFSRSTINFTAPSPLVTGAVINNNNPYVTFFPFPNATNFHGEGFRNCYNLVGEIKMLNATGDINMRLTINASKVTKFILPNATRFINTNQPFTNASMLNEIDMRSVIEWTGDACSWTGVNLQNLTIRANEVLKTAGVGGTMHPWLLSAITGGAAIIFYDDLGNEVYSYQDVIDRAILEGFTLPPLNIRIAHQNLFDALITEGTFWNSRDTFKLYTSNDASLADFSKIDWKIPYGHLDIIYGGETYTINGVKGNGVDSYRDTGFKPSTANHLTMNSQGITHIFFDDYSINNQGLIGIEGFNPSRRFGIAVNVNGGNTRVPFLHDQIINHMPRQTGDRMVSFGRDGDIKFQFDGNYSTVVSTAIPPLLTVNYYINAAIHTSLNTAGRYVNGTCGMFAAGSLITQTQDTFLRSAINSYLTEIGLPTIS